MSAFKQFAERTAAALRALATKTPNAPAAPAPTLGSKLLKAITPEPKPYRIMIRDADGNLVSKPATAEEALDYCNSPRVWRRIA